MWSPKGQQVMIPTPGQPKVHYGLGAVNYHTGETVVLIRRRKRRQEVAELLQALVDKHPTGTIYVAWDNVSTHQDDEIEMVVRAAAGRGFEPRRGRLTIPVSIRKEFGNVTLLVRT